MCECVCVCAWGGVCVWRCVHSESRAELSCLFLRDEPEQGPSTRPRGRVRSARPQLPSLGSPRIFYAMLVHGGSKPLQLHVRNPWILQSLGRSGVNCAAVASCGLWGCPFLGDGLVLLAEEAEMEWTAQPLLVL